MNDLHPSYPILEFDPAPEAIIEPAKLIQPIGAPERCVVCFFQEVITGLEAEGRLTLISTRKSEIGGHPVYEMNVDGARLALFHPGVGAPLAAGLLDEVIPLGCRKFIACGSAGVLNREIAVGHVIVPTSAVRDEGTSYHYLPPDREVAATPQAVAAIEQVLRTRNVPHILGKTWTTDAIFRETAGKVARRRAEGCLAVEMEAAAFFAVAQFRGVTFGQMLYGGDDVSGDVWDHRDYASRLTVREKLFWLAVEACLRL
jgi:uridine phosphorylase